MLRILHFLFSVQGWMNPKSLCERLQLLSCLSITKHNICITLGSAVGKPRLTWTLIILYHSRMVFFYLHIAEEDLAGSRAHKQLPPHKQQLIIAASWEKWAMLTVVCISWWCSQTWCNKMWCRSQDTTLLPMHNRAGEPPSVVLHEPAEYMLWTGASKGHCFS